MDAGFNQHLGNTDKILKHAYLHDTLVLLAEVSPTARKEVSKEVGTRLGCSLLGRVLAQHP